jgi:hypothetical protein
VLLGILEWLESTPGSVAIRESIWTYPIVEASHVLSLCLFAGLTSMWDLRLLGLNLRGTSVSEAAARLLPWVHLGFACMAVTGLLLFWSDPVRFYGNVFFQVKMVMLVLAGVNAVLFHLTTYRGVTAWDLDDRPPSRARAAAVVSLALWSLIIVSGRMIAYNWFDS